ncbi:MAG: ABC transporter permease [Salinivirgaceae bacterium]|jgi:putative ABC transport system permease protein|nr:ABC transporter permease [Salinivirgaceae bacterium]
MRTNLIYAFRNILNSKINTFITVFGLSVAIACSLLIYSFVSQEYSYNNFHKNADYLYRINYESRYFNGDYKDVRVEREIADNLKKEIPQIKKSTEYRYAFENVLMYNNRYFDAEMSYAGADFFDMFSFPFISNKPEKIFTNPYEIVLTKELADKLVDNGSYDDLLDNVVEFPLSYGTTKFTIVGIISDIPHNSTINFDAVISGKSGRNFGGCDNSFGYTTVYYQIKDNVKAKDAARGVNNYISNFYKSRVGSMQDRNQMPNTDDAFVPFVLPLKDVYLAGDIGNCFESSTNPNNFIILLTIGFLILLIACSNYTILSLGQYMKKIGEVGIRKAMGANRANIFSIFLAEGILITLSALIIGVILSILFIPVFGKLAQAEIYTELINIPKISFFAGSLFAGIVLFTSIIPVLVFSRVTPNQMASKKLSIGNKSNLSQIFVSIQYSLSIILIIVTIFIVRQSNLLKNKSLGLNSEYIIDIQADRIDDDKIPQFVNELKEHVGVVNVTKTSRNFMNGSSNSFVDRGDGEQVSVFRNKVDENYIPTLGLKIIKGQNFTESNVKERDRSMIVNNQFLELMDISDNPIGKTYSLMGINFSIIGVVDDFHFFDLKRKIQPIMLFARTNTGNGYYNVLLKFHPQQLGEVIKHIEYCYEKAAPGKSLTHTFWDEKLQERYDDEERWSNIIGYASVIAIIISSLGLFGLTILLISQRVKEIGVRKVNGAKALEVLVTINKAFIGWLCGSIIIAIPVAFYIVDKWLNSFPYKVPIDWWVFILAGSIAFLVALFTVSWQSLKAARRNPVEALRYE